MLRLTKGACSDIFDIVAIFATRHFFILQELAASAMTS